VFRMWLKYVERNCDILYELHDKGTLDAVHERYSSAIDCTKCANCCRVLTLPFKQTELHHIAKSLDQSIETFEQTFLLAPGHIHAGCLKPPCPMLDGNLCLIYPTRPEVCREFPPTPRADNMLATLRFHSVCPIVFNVMEELKILSGWKHIWADLRKHAVDDDDDAIMDWIRSNT
jgi:Fe-S-cluster containining protein